jgi:hypothetical protein
MSPARELKPSFSGRQACARFAILALIAGALLAYATPHGLLVFSGDSLEYVEGARNLLAGHGYSVSIPPETPAPIIHFPPLYSLFIAAAGILVRDIYGAARWVGVGCYAASVYFMCVMVWRATQENFRAGLIAGLIFCFNPTLLQLFGSPLSETVFIPLGIAGQVALIEYFESENAGWLLGSALLFGLTAAARYSGVVWMATGPFTVLVCARGGFLKRFGKAVLFGLVSMIPAIAVAVRNKMVSHSVAGRSLGMHPVSIHHFQDGLETIAAWFLPWRFGHWPYGLVVTVLLALVVADAVRRLPGPRYGRPVVFWVSSISFIVLYAAHLLLAISFLHYNTPVDDRLLAPVEVSVIAVLGAWLGAGASMTPAGVRFAVCGLVLLLSLSRIQPVVHKSRVNSGGYRGPTWRSNDLVQALFRLPASAAIYSNKPEAVYLSIERPVLPLPYKQDPMSLAPNKDAAAEIAQMEQTLKATGGVLVYFAPVSTDAAYDGGVPLSRLHEFTESEIRAMIPLSLFGRSSGADILKPPL